MTTPTPHPRWYHLTPARFFIGLLVLQVFLFLSERFQWLALNEKKGWTVLIAVGVVGLAVLVMLFWGLVCLCLRRRFQFGFRALLVFVVTVSVPLGWFAWEMERARRQREAVEGVAKAGGVAYYDYQQEEDESFWWAVPAAEPPTPGLLRRVLGDNFFYEVHTVSFSPILTSIHGVYQEMHFYEPTRQVTDVDLAHLQELSNLDEVNIYGTGVTDDGLQHLTGMTKLKRLSLHRTHVTDEGVEEAREALPNCEILYNPTHP